MELTVFAKKNITKEGKVFYRYFGKLQKKTGEEITVTIKFREECGAPKGEKCPMIISVDKKDCNFSSKTRTGFITDPDGNNVEHEYIDNTLWVSAWNDTGKEYIDRSMDEFID